MPKFYLNSALLVLIATLLASCGSSKPASPPQEYKLNGVVVRLDPQVRTATIKHSRIEGWMEAMTMEFPVREQKEFDKLSPGKAITATVYVSGDAFWIGNVQPAAAKDPARAGEP